jgi:hypothetical protein
LGLVFGAGGAGGERASEERERQAPHA